MITHVSLIFNHQSTSEQWRGKSQPNPEFINLSSYSFSSLWISWGRSVWFQATKLEKRNCILIYLFFFRLFLFNKLLYSHSTFTPSENRRTEERTVHYVLRKRIGASERERKTRLQSITVVWPSLHLHRFDYRYAHSLPAAVYSTDRTNWYGISIFG